MNIEELMKKDGWSVRKTYNKGVEYIHFVKNNILIDLDDMISISDEEIDKMSEEMQ